MCLSTYLECVEGSLSCFQSWDGFSQVTLTLCKWWESSRGWGRRGRATQHRQHSNVMELTTWGRETPKTDLHTYAQTYRQTFSDRYTYVRTYLHTPVIYIDRQVNAQTDRQTDTTTHRETHTDTQRDTHLILECLCLCCLLIGALLLLFDHLAGGLHFSGLLLNHNQHPLILCRRLHQFWLQFFQLLLHVSNLGRKMV